MGIRRAFRAGLDLDQIEGLAERYIYDETSHHYLDREFARPGTAFRALEG